MKDKRALNIRFLLIKYSSEHRYLHQNEWKQTYPDMTTNCLQPNDLKLDPRANGNSISGTL